MTTPALSESAIQESLLQGLRKAFDDNAPSVLMVETIKESDGQVLIGGTSKKPEIDETIAKTIAIAVGSEIYLNLKQYLDATGASKQRIGVALLGTKNGVNMTFTTPQKFINEGGVTIAIYLNGIRLDSASQYLLSESIADQGYDTVTLVGVAAPTLGQPLTADYAERT